MSNEIRCLIELRADESRQSPGRLVGTLMKYGVRASDRPEMFLQGSLTWPADGIVIREQHNRESPVMRVVPEVKGDSVVIDAPLPDTQRGRDAATMIRNGTFRGLSVEFKAKAEKLVAGVRQITVAALTGAGLVDDPAYQAATVQVRARGVQRRRRVWL